MVEVWEPPYQSLDGVVIKTAGEAGRLWSQLHHEAFKDFWLKSFSVRIWVVPGILDWRMLKKMCRSPSNQCIHLSIVNTWGSLGWWSHPQNPTAVEMYTFNFRFMWRFWWNLGPCRALKVGPRGTSVTNVLSGSESLDLLTALLRSAEHGPKECSKIPAPSRSPDL